MSAEPALFSYRAIGSVIHRVNPGVKLAIMVASTIAVFSGSLPILAAISAFLALATTLAKTRWASIGKNAKIILMYGLVIVAFKFVGIKLEKAIVETGLRESGIYLWQLTAVLFAGTVFYETTSSLEIRHTLSAIQNGVAFVLSPFLRLYRRITGRQHELPDVAFLLSLTIGFIPRVFSAWSDLDRSWAARGGNVRRGLKANFRRCTILVPTLIAVLLAIASDTEKAIRNRSE